MNNPNVLRAVGEALEAHHITARPDEKMADTVSRALNISDDEAGRWLDALNHGCTVEEANRRAGIVSHQGNESLLTTIAKFIGSALATVTPESS